MNLKEFMMVVAAFFFGYMVSAIIKQIYEGDLVEGSDPDADKASNKEARKARKARKAEMIEATNRGPVSPDAPSYTQAQLDQGFGSTVLSREAERTANYTEGAAFCGQGYYGICEPDGCKSNDCHMCPFSKARIEPLKPEEQDFVSKSYQAWLIFHGMGEPRKEGDEPDPCTPRKIGETLSEYRERMKDPFP